jgi:hypothetical protein
MEDHFQQRVHSRPVVGRHREMQHPLSLSIVTDTLSVVCLYGASRTMGRDSHFQRLQKSEDGTTEDTQETKVSMY